MEVVSNNETDPVVGRVPVLLSTKLAGSLNLFQFLVRRKKFSENTMPLPQARYKAHAGTIALDVPLAPATKFYNDETGRDLGSSPTFTTDQHHNQGDCPEEDVEERLLKITYKSTVSPQQANHYVAVFQNGALHITPVASFQQFTPSLEHIDKQARLKKAADARYADDMSAHDVRVAKAAESIAAKKAAAPVFARIETPEMIEARKRNVIHMRKEAENEPYRQINYHHQDTEESLHVKKMMLGSHVNSTEEDLDESTYLDMISPQTSSDKKTAQTLLKIRPGALSREEIKLLKLEDRAKAVMLNANILPFEMIVRLCNADADAVLQVLPAVAVPIHNVWVVASHFCYNGRAIHARNYLIHMLRECTEEYPIVERGVFDKIACLSVKATQQMLSELAVIHSENGKNLYWRLRYAVTRDQKADLWKAFSEGPLVQAAKFLELNRNTANTDQDTLQLPLEKIHPYDSQSVGILNQAGGLIQNAGTVGGRKVAARAPLKFTATSSLSTINQMALENHTGNSLLAHDVTVKLKEAGVILKTDLMMSLYKEYPAVELREIERHLEASCRIINNGCVLLVRHPENLPLEAMRQAMLDQFTISPVRTKNELLGAATRALSRKITVADFNAVVNEVSILKGKTYIWKTSA